jgi:hypothetical protein
MRPTQTHGVARAATARHATSPREAPALRAGDGATRGRSCGEEREHAREGPSHRRSGRAMAALREGPLRRRAAVMVAALREGPQPRHTAAAPWTGSVPRGRRVKGVVVGSRVPVRGLERAPLVRRGMVQAGAAAVRRAVEARVEVEALVRRQTEGSVARTALPVASNKRDCVCSRPVLEMLRSTSV